MLEPLIDLPTGVVGFEAVGEIHASDYTDVLRPALDAAADTGEVRFVYVFGERFESYSAGATWQDAKLGLGHHKAWKRTAFVSDLDWVRHLAGAFGWMVPGDFKHFDLADKEAAISWVAADGSDG